MSPATFQDWKDRFLQGGRQTLAGGGDRAKSHAREVENLKRIIGEITVANDILKNHGGGKAVRVQAVSEAMEHVSLNRALALCGMSKRAWYHTGKPRDIRVDPQTAAAVRRMASERPTYGTRRMAAQIARETRMPTSRKQIQRIFRRLGWTGPQKTKNDIIRSGSRPARPEAPNRLWETDMTYVWCGNDGRCYCFNVTGCLARR